MHSSKLCEAGEVLYQCGYRKITGFRFIATGFLTGFQREQSDLSCGPEDRPEGQKLDKKQFDKITGV